MSTSPETRRVNIQQEPWTQNDIDFMKEEYAKGSTTEDIAAALNRTPGAVFQKYKKMKGGKFELILKRIDQLVECVDKLTVAVGNAQGVVLPTIPSMDEFAAAKAKFDATEVNGALFFEMSNTAEQVKLRSALYGHAKKTNKELKSVSSKAGLTIIRTA